MIEQYDGVVTLNMRYISRMTNRDRTTRDGRTTVYCFFQKSNCHKMKTCVSTGRNGQQRLQ